MIRIDAHQHFWRVDDPWHEWPTAELPTIHRDFGLDDLAPLLRAGGVDGSVLVQAQPSAAETAALLAVAERYDTVLAVVGWADLIADDAVERIRELARHPRLAGLRPMLQDLPAEWILQDAAQASVSAMVECGLVFDALIRPAHLPAITTLARRYPALSIVIDHAAKPDIAGGAVDAWSEDLAAAAACANIHCKLSGLATEAGEGWSAPQLTPYAARVVELFGPDRLLWGSDWPVVLLAADYAAWLRVAEALVPRAMHAAVFGGTAARVYGIDPDG